MENNPVRLPVKHQRARMSMQNRSTRYVPECSVWLHLRSMGKESSRQTSANLLPFIRAPNSQWLHIRITGKRFLNRNPKPLNISFELSSYTNSLSHRLEIKIVVAAELGLFPSLGYECLVDVQ